MHEFVDHPPGENNLGLQEYKHPQQRQDVHLSKGCLYPLCRCTLLLWSWSHLKTTSWQTRHGTALCSHLDGSTSADSDMVSILKACLSSSPLLARPSTRFYTYPESTKPHVDMRHSRWSFPSVSFGHIYMSFSFQFITTTPSPASSSLQWGSSVIEPEKVFKIIMGPRAAEEEGKNSKQQKDEVAESRLSRFTPRLDIYVALGKLWKTRAWLSFHICQTGSYWFRPN